MENKHKKSNNKFRSVNSSVRGFDAKRDSIIWDHGGNSVQWVGAKDILLNKFKSEGIYKRIYNVSSGRCRLLNITTE
jgi:hypothetical protein